MYEFKFDGYSAEQCERYLKRIGAEYDGEPNLKNLDVLISRHQKSVPFENLALIMNRGSINLDPQSLYQKIVLDHRGGFCFELNGAFLLLLKGLGYDAAGCMARVGLPFIGELLNPDHRGILVRLDGKRYFCDVGMGGPKADWAIEFADKIDEIHKQTRHGQTYWIEDTYEGWKMLKNEGSESDGSVIIFSPTAMLPIDFYGNCRDLVERGGTIFHTERMVNLCLENGYIDVRNNTLKISDDGRVSQRDFEEKEFWDIMEKYFGISISE